jgi:hypothetical protein
MIPLVQYMHQFQCQILLAATGPQKMILEKTFTGITFLSPPKYGVKYADGKGNLVFGLMRQLPRLLRVIKAEQEWLKGIHEQFHLDLIISDNRYGMHLPGVHSVIITHQIAPLSGLGGLIDRYIKKTHLKYLERFNECWIPDMPQGGLSGNLSHNVHLPSHTSYIGPVSRFAHQSAPVPRNGRLLILLSGPEPSRTNFERKLLDQLKAYQGPYTLVRGLPGHNETIPHALNHAPADELLQLIREAEFIICRSGYTTIMDLSALGRTALLIPTPGQTEQEYLAEYLTAKGSFISCRENTFNLQKEVDRLRNFVPDGAAFDFELYQPALQSLLKKLNPED